MEKGGGVDGAYKLDIVHADFINGVCFETRFANGTYHTKHSLKVMRVVKFVRCHS